MKSREYYMVKYFNGCRYELWSSAIHPKQTYWSEDNIPMGKWTEERIRQHFTRYFPQEVRDHKLYLFRSINLGNHNNYVESLGII